MEGRLNKLKLNSALGVIYQACAIIVNLVLPRFFLKYYGSDVNGLISSITQFLAFINLADMGISAIISSALYKPLADNDNEKISNILAFARKFFCIVGIILLIYVGALTAVYPLMVKESFSFIFTVTLLWAMSISQFGQYFIGITNQILLIADQRSYVQLFINTVTIVLNAVAAVLIMMYGGSVQLVKLTTSAIFLLRPLFLYGYVRTHYNIDYSAKADGSTVPQKKSGIFQHVAYIIYSNTDVAVLTLFSSLSNVSIYSVYVLVNNGVKSFIMAICNSIQSTFGNIIAKNENKKLVIAYDLYDWMLHFVCTFAYTICGVLIVPFILTYTRGINDANYDVPLFATVITLAIASNTIREGMFVMIKAAGHYRQTQWASILEAVINVVSSVIFVFNFGLVGVAIGTLMATTFFGIFEMVYLSYNIIKRPPRKFVKQILVDALYVSLIIGLTRWIHITERSYLVWAKYAVVAAVIGLLVGIVIQLVFYRKNLITSWNLLHRRIKK